MMHLQWMHGRARSIQLHRGLVRYALRHEMVQCLGHGQDSAIAKFLALRAGQLVVFSFAVVAVLNDTAINITLISESKSSCIRVTGSASTSGTTSTVLTTPHSTAASASTTNSGHLASRSARRSNGRLLMHEGNKVYASEVRHNSGVGQQLVTASVKLRDTNAAEKEVNFLKAG